MKVDRVLLTVCVLTTALHAASAAIPLLAYAAPAIFGLGMLGGFGDKLGLGGLFGKKKQPSYSPMFGGSFGGINAQDMSMMFMSGFPPSGGMQGGMQGGMMGGLGGGMPGNPNAGIGGMGGGGGMGSGFGQQSMGFGGSGFGRRRRRRSIRPVV